MALRRYKRRLPANRSIGMTTFRGSLGPVAFTPFNLLGPTGSITPAQAQVAFHGNPNTLDMLAWQ